MPCRGNNGYVWIARKDNDCGVATAATYVAFVYDIHLINSGLYLIIV